MPSLRYSLVLIGWLSGPLLAQGPAARNWVGPADARATHGQDALATGAAHGTGSAAKVTIEPSHVRPAAYQAEPRGDPPTAPSAAGSVQPPGPRDENAPAHRELGSREGRPPAARLSSPADAVAPRSTGSVITTLASLALVVGAFLLVMWFARRRLPRGAGPLPSDVLEVLGRATIGPKQPVSLLRLGDRLLLVAIHPGNAETLAEITDPDEVTRMVSICQQARPNSASGAFRQVLQQMSKPSRAGKAEDRHAS